MRNTEELRGMTTEELQERLTDVNEEFENLQLQKASHNLTNPLRLRIVRRELARIKTILREKELGLNKNKSTVNE
ncbi:MAG: 50S ribosomal protein L29 [Caldithrix sp.]|nr:50S ribosomal protein L29 [Caldithrix sp.]